MVKKGVIGLSILFLLLYIVPLNVRPVAVPDEARYGEISREMLDTKDFIVPRLNGLRYFEKPVLGYWLNAASMSLFGDNGFAIRFPSSLAVGLTALTIFLMVRRFHRCESTALLAAFIYMTFVGVYGMGTFCLLDNLLTFFLTAMLSCLFVAGANDTGRKRNWWLLLCGVFCGTAFLTKGFLVIIVPSVIMVPFFLDGSLPWLLFIPVILVRRSSELLRKPLIRFCVCWTILPLVFFSISSGKTITYVLPCFPPLAVLLGIGLTEYFRKGREVMFKYCSLLLNVLTGLMVVALFSIAFTPALHRKIYGSGEDYKLWYCVCAAVVCFVVLLITLRMQNGLRKTFMHGLPAIIIMLVFPFAVRYLDIEGMKMLLNERGNRQVAIIIKETTKDRTGIHWAEPEYQTTWNDFWFAVY
jgi:4-amino-4-deoxy-L-arabinose transferase-like glycosyltransferase